MAIVAFLGIEFVVAFDPVLDVVDTVLFEVANDGVAVTAEFFSSVVETFLFASVALLLLNASVVVDDEFCCGNETPFFATDRGSLSDRISKVDGPGI